MRQKLIDRFNSDPTQSPFIARFQEIAIDKLALNLNKKQVRKLIRQRFNQNPDSYNVDLDKLLLLSLKVEPEIYLLAQETAKKITGRYMIMSELLYILLTGFIETYREEPFTKTPFKHIRKGARFKNLEKFNAAFSQFYCNHVVRFPKTQ